ncbi:MAG: tetraacyldisaccharide 4'-kinase [Vicinamibacteria bacterium]
MLDLLYRQAMRTRRRWYARPGAARRLARPVISVGNLSVGGTGKTPVVAAIAARLVAMGERPSVLSRGYGRRRVTRAPLVVSDGAGVHASVDEAGDEPLLLARMVPGAVVVVAADRHAAGVVAERDHGCTVHVMDDGFQHVRLARDFDVIVTTPGEIAGGRVLPFGRLREGAETARVADALVVVGATGKEAAAEARALGVARSCGATRRLESPVLLPGPAGADPAEVLARGLPVVAAAGVAHPERFFDGLREAGWRVAATLPFPDHHTFTADDVRRIQDAAAAAGATLALVTEKDAVKIDALGPLPLAVARVPLALDFDESAAIDGWIAGALAAGRRRGTAGGAA